MMTIRSERLGMDVEGSQCDLEGEEERSMSKQMLE